MLQVKQLQAFYGPSQVLHGVTFDVQPGEIVALLGRNGAGRSTTAKALMGLVRCAGSVRWQGHELVGLLPFVIAQRGLGCVAEGRDIFPRLTVQQNLQLGQKGKKGGGRWTLDAVYRLFPALLPRQHTLGGVLSGGEQQMLALGRALLGHPQLLIVDEPTEGLAPQVVQQVADCLRVLQAEGMAVLLVEQKRALALALADRVLVLGQGRVVFDGTPPALAANAAVRQQWLDI